MFNYSQVNTDKHVINYFMNKGKWSKKDLRRVARFLATLEGHMSVHRTRVKLLDWKIKI